MRQMMDRLLARLGLVRVSTLRDQLNYARSIGKRLDEHRELVESLTACAPMFLKERWWHVGHMEIQDDYLMRLYHLVYGCWPETGGRQSNGEFVRSRPAVFGPCALPEYNKDRPNSEC
ncbi:hypothetical protein [Thauera butanivorans]|uniref:hypothetical protein n=1 Tax=Thauera butanivorans TaxID=86174 RepID=UPI000839241F|nr:hypothetical protein [Thauera butanivorans]